MNNYNNIRGYTFNNIIGESNELKKVINECKSIANSPSTVLICGESGCGKELLAQAIHNASDRKNKPFVKINLPSRSLMDPILVP